MALDRIALEGIERHTKWLAYSGHQVEYFVKMLLAQRPFETQAEDNLDQAEKVLTDALESVRKTRNYYKSLPVEGQAVSDRETG